MKKTSITEAKNNLGALIDGFKGGSAVLIRDRARPVARLEPVTADLDAAEGRLLRLVREGIVRRAAASRPQRCSANRRPEPRRGTGC